MTENELYHAITELLDKTRAADNRQALTRIVEDYGYESSDLFPYHDCREGCGHEDETPECGRCGCELTCTDCHPINNECGKCGSYDLRCMDCKPIEELPQPAVTSYTGRSAFA